MLSQKATIHLENLFTNITTKFSKLFSYKQITHNEHLSALNGLNVYANYSYFKNLIKMIYIYLYHRNDKGGSFNINAECLSNGNNNVHAHMTKVKIVFSNGRVNEMLHKCFTSITESERTIKDTARIHNKIQTINMIEEIITVLSSLLGIKLEINVNMNIHQVSIAVVISAFHNEDFANEHELNERSPLHMERFNVVERTMCAKINVSKLKNESNDSESDDDSDSSDDNVCLKLNECRSINNDNVSNMKEQFILNSNSSGRVLNKQKTLCERKTLNYLSLNYNHNKKRNEYDKLLQSKRKNNKTQNDRVNTNTNTNNSFFKSQQCNINTTTSRCNNNNNNNNNVQPRKRQSILNSLLKTIAKNNSNQLLPHNEDDDFIKQHSYTHLIPKVNHNILTNDNDFNNSLMQTMNNHCYQSKIHHSHSMLHLTLRDNYIHNTNEHYLLNEDNESECHMKHYHNETKSSFVSASPPRQYKKHVEICLNNNVHLNHLTIINHTTTSPIPEVNQQHSHIINEDNKDVDSNKICIDNNECSDCSSDHNNAIKKRSTIESLDMCIKHTLNEDTQLPTSLNGIPQKETMIEEDNNVLSRRNKKLPSGLFTFIALDSLDENIKFPKKLQNNNSKTKKLPLIKMNSIQNKTKYTLCNNNNSNNIILNPCQNNCNDVLIVDDEQFNVTSLANVLLNINITSDKCYNGKECMEKIQEKINMKCKCDKSMYKLILLDVLMPYMNGIDAARKIQELVNNGYIDNSIKIVFISACVDQLSDFDELQKQIPIVKEFCQKPVKRSKIEEVVDKYYNV